LLLGFAVIFEAWVEINARPLAEERVQWFLIHGRSARFTPA
jgi:hypothetical protein